MPTFRNTVSSIFMKLELAECYEPSAYKTQNPGNNPEENIKLSKHGESLKSIIHSLKVPAVPCYRRLIFETGILNPSITPAVTKLRVYKGTTYFCYCDRYHLAPR